MTAPERRTDPVELDIDSIEMRARAGRAFSNGTEWETWSGRWCETCSHENADIDLFCPLADLAFLTEKTPQEWGDPESDTDGRYRCSQYAPARDGIDARSF